MAYADLDILIRTTVTDGRTRVSYTLNSPAGRAGFSYREIAGPSLARPPEQYQSYLIDKLRKLGEGRDLNRSRRLTPKELEGKLTAIGRELYLELFSPEMRQVYREIRRSGVQSVRIISDEPWIPWEMVRPYDDSPLFEIIDDDFLCLQFELTRWLAGSAVPPVSELRVRRLACIRTTTSLAKTDEERAFFAELATMQPGVQDASLELSAALAAEAFLEAGSVDLLHFAGHGFFDASQPNESALPFPDGTLLRPIDLQGPLATRMKQVRPLVFLNACSVGQQGFSLTRLGGWAERWVRGCECGAFVAPLWPVADTLALEFARTFYRALAAGETFGQAGRSARRRARDLAPGDPSWLAYSIYADANGRLVFGDAELPQPPALRAAAPEILRSIRNANSLIARKAWGFVGRQWLFDAIDHFVARETSGYALILGDPGVGKTALLAEMVRRRDLPHHFNLGSEGIQRPEHFLPNICAQLIARFNLGDSSLPPEVSRDSAVLRTLLERVAAKLRPQGEKLLLLVDALDEADPKAVVKDANTLYLPTDLPAGVFVVATSRRGGYRLKLNCPEHVIDLQTESANTFADVRLFAESWIGRDGIRDYLQQQNLGDTDFVSEMVERSEGNFMYLRYVLPEIERGAYATRQFDTLPVGLQSYYEDHWCRMRDGDPAAWFDYKLPVLVALAIAREPISLDLIAEFSGIERRARIQDVLEEWSPFLQTTEVWSKEHSQTRYRLYHASFFDFIAAKDQVRQERVDLKAANLRAADPLWNMLFPEG